MGPLCCIPPELVPLLLLLLLLLPVIVIPPPPPTTGRGPLVEALMTRRADCSQGLSGEARVYGFGVVALLPLEGP